MKKILLILLGIFLLTGCSKSNDNLIKDVTNKIERSKSYTLEGTMQISNDEEIFDYDIEVNYLKDNYYKVEMKNQSNEYTQIILKNDDGLYVVTPKLNKSFKFDSNWPNNSSQAYILEALVNDIKKDNKVEVKKDKKESYIKCKVNYPNNSDLAYEKIYFNDNNEITKVEVYSKADLVKITVKFNKYDLKAGNKKKIFNLDNYITESKKEDCTENCEKETISQIDTAIYPLYMPSNTYLSGSEIVNDENDSRVILTYSGDKSFVIVEENANVNVEPEIIPVYGDPVMLNDTIAAMGTNSMYWTSNDVEYYLVSQNLSSSEMVFVATSLGDYSSTMVTK